MKYKGQQGSSNIEDRRGGGGRRGGGMKLGLFGTIVVVVLALIFGENPLQMLQQVQNTGGSAPVTQQAPNSADDELAYFVSVVLQYTEEVWDQAFQQEYGKPYKKPVLVLFDGQVQSACGMASSATGPFYCPGDDKLYIDLSFYSELKNRFGAPGDFAMAYVVAHEVAHHVQNLLGITDQVHSRRRSISQAEYNQLSVRLELQADFLAGYWAHHTDKMRDVLDPGDIEEALRAANAIGDDRLQRQAQGYVVPESFTHGTSEQRMRWFKKGFETGDLSQGDTFGARSL